ncbi:hypothetical protein OH77DRAFT_1420763 [Trametes cingulata]|nr:hypothetical protein OH77DRAFT_1420763 [Trametes cingulata]
MTSSGGVRSSWYEVRFLLATLARSPAAIRSIQVGTVLNGGLQNAAGILWAHLLHRVELVLLPRDQLPAASILLRRPAVVLAIHEALISGVADARMSPWDPLWASVTHRDVHSQPVATPASSAHPLLAATSGLYDRLFLELLVAMLGRRVGVLSVCHLAGRS